MIDHFDSESFIFGVMLGVAIGAQIIYWFARWVRCENCCWKDEK